MIATRTHAKRSLIHRFAADQSGLALIEFAYVFPILLMLYLGGAQLCDTIAAYRKMTITTRALADIASQYSSVSDADLDSVLNASSKIMSPYPTANAAMTVFQVSMDGTGTPKVTWSRGLNATPPAVDSTYTLLPASIRVANTSVVVSTVNYTFVPRFGTYIIGSIPLADKIYMSPRTVVNITKKAT